MPRSSYYFTTLLLSLQKLLLLYDQISLMSIIPINDRQNTVTDPLLSLDYIWDHHLFNNIWNPFDDFSFSSQIFPNFSMETQKISWRETARAHVFKAYLPGFDRDEVLVFIDDDGILQISTVDGKFMSRFKLPENATTCEIDGFMENGVLLVTVGKEVSSPESVAPRRSGNNVRVIEITGDED